MVKRLAAYVLLFFIPVVSFATQCYEYRRNSSDTWGPSAPAKCSAMASAYSTANAPRVYSVSSVEGNTCNLQYTASDGTVYKMSSSLDVREVPCGDPVCKSQQGQSKVVNFTVGYTRSSNIDTDPNWKLIGAPNKVPASGLLCHPQSPCEMRFDGFSDSDMAWQSAAPTPNGLYRLSLDISATFTGETCTPTEVDNAALSKTAPIPPCPGFTGEVNGVPGCYGTASNPTSNDVSETKPKKPESGNPAAGEKPATGEGSGSDGKGRTPSTGNGGPGGGPAAAAGSGSAPDGTTPKPEEGKEQANCGAPGQPRCQIDESGTPNGGDSKDRLIDAVNKAADDQKAAIENASKLKADGWTFSFALPSGCTALTLPGYQIPGQGALSIDVCKWQPMIHDVMTMLWLICTVWGCINMVGSTQRGY